MLKFIEQNQVRWFDHIRKMKGSREVKRIWNAKTIPRRRKGRIRTTWRKVIEKRRN